jgi:hypothetical protein
VHRKGGTKAERDAAEEEFHSFAKQTYDALAIDENASSLKLLCRLDISVMLNQVTGRLDYFVNEVERGCLVCLFGSVGDGVFPAHKIGDEMLDNIIDMLDEWYSVSE